MTAADVQKWLDAWCLDRMISTDLAFGLNNFLDEPYITRDVARAVLRSLRDRGFAIFVRGLWTDEGMPAGAGYAITKAGEVYLKTLEDIQ